MCVGRYIAYRGFPSRRVSLAAPIRRGRGKLPPRVTDTTQQQPAVSVRDVVRHFGRFAALRGITADFAPGQLYVLLGENGAGKSTLLRVIAGLLAPSRGSVRVLGSENIRAVATRFGYMGHAPLLYDEMSAVENLEYFSALYGINDRARCEEAIRTVGLDPALERRVGQYSQGMRQRISLARAIVHGPELLFLDEPFSNVDVRSAKQMTTLLAKMRDAGTTIFVVTHQAALMEPVADECIVLDAGRLVAREKGIPARLLTPYLAEERAALQSHARKHRGQTVTSAPGFWAITRRSLVKDLRLEWRSKDAINSMLFFALLVVVIFSFGFDPTAEESRKIAGGLLWVAILFATVVALNQTWTRELRNQVLDAYRLSPAPPEALFLSKTVGNFIFVSILEVLMVPLFVVFYNLRSVGPWWQLLVVALLATWALVVNGTFFAALSIRTRSREIMLPLILFPVSIPALLAMVDATTSILTGDNSPIFWIRLLAVYDLVFTTVGLILFEPVLNAE